MTAALRHRGPDGKGIFADSESEVWLGHRRLSIIDIAGGEQPMASEDKKIQVVFNGEIYNHRDLRRQLIAAGHKFRTDHSDTEVLVHGYEEWGEDLPHHLNGMFAFAIYDKRRHLIFLARDRFGKKPMFYLNDKGRFVFGSELDMFVKNPLLSPMLSKQSLMKYFGYGYFPAPHTPYEKIFKLPAGHILVFDIKSHSHRIKRYWKFSLDPQPLRRGSEQALADELRHLLKEAVRRRLECDVPLGFFLSGGLDSSAVVGLARELLPEQKLFTFSLGFQEASFDETRYAKLASDAYGTEHIAEYCSFEDMKLRVPDIMRRLDEPVGDPSILPTFLVSELARKHVTVALTGDGSDELFAGYDPFLVFNKAATYHRLTPRPVHEFIRSVFNKIWPVSERNMNFGFKVRRALKGLSYCDALWAPNWWGPLEANEVSELFGEPVHAEELYSEVIDLWNESPHLTGIERLVEFYIHFFLQDNILLKVDRASMLNSLEVRSPFLDLDVIEFARRLPMEMRLRDGKTKYILKQAMEGIVPDEIIHRPKKGFGIPLTRWLKEISPPAKGASPPCLRHDWLKQRWEQHRVGHIDDRNNLWCWYSLAAKYKTMPFHISG